MSTDEKADTVDERPITPEPCRLLTDEEVIRNAARAVLPDDVYTGGLIKDSAATIKLILEMNMSLGSQLAVRICQENTAFVEKAVLDSGERYRANKAAIEELEQRTANAIKKINATFAELKAKMVSIDGPPRTETLTNQ